MKNPDPKKQAQEIIYSMNKTASQLPLAYFNNKPVKTKTNIQTPWDDA